MFNIWSYDRQKAAHDKLEKIKANFVADEAQRKNKQERFVMNYKKRVDNFIMNMVEHPIITQNKAPEPIKVRIEEPTKFLGSPTMSVRTFKHERDRIQEAIEKQKDLDYGGHHVPIKQEFRRRYPEKEIQPDMHFTSTGVDRIAANLERMINNSVELTGTQPQKVSDSFLLEISKSPVATKRFMAKNLLPELHFKTHFKAATSLGLDSLLDQYEKEIQRAKAQQEKERREASFLAVIDGTPRSPQNMDNSVLDSTKNEPMKSDIKKKSKKSSLIDDTIESNSTAEKKLAGLKKSGHEVLDPKEISKNILLKCNVIRKKKENVPTIHKGDGHLMSMSDKSIRQIYDSVYHKSLDTTVSPKYKLKNNQ